MARLRNYSRTFPIVFRNSAAVILENGFELIDLLSGAGVVVRDGLLSERLAIQEDLTLIVVLLSCNSADVR